MTFQEFASKKVAGVPVLYLIGAGVIILGIVAWRMKPSAESAEEAPADAADTDGEYDDNLYDDFETKGSVTVAQAPAVNPELANAAIGTNQEWLVKGTQYLVKERNIQGTVASSALNKYLNGQDRSFDEDSYVNLVIKEYGLPPDGTDDGGKVGAKPATKQGTPPTTHTVAGTTDNTYTALSALYYGNTNDDSVDLLQAANIGKLGNGPWAVGTQVRIPAYTAPRYYTTSSSPTKKRELAKDVAAKFGLGRDQLAALNDPRGGVYQSTYAFAPGTRIRIA